MKRSIFPQLSIALGRLTLLRGLAGSASPIIAKQFDLVAPFLSFISFAFSTLLYVIALLFY